MVEQNMDDRIVEVRFFESDSEAPFATSTMSGAQLPDTFEIDTVLHLGGEDWRVVGAEPPQKRDFIEGGVLDLFLVRHETHPVDPSQILYSLPTINNEIPGVEHVDSLENVVVFQEDDWRQFEFIAQRHAPLINEELIDIEYIHDHHSQGAGFQKLHLRRKIVEPLNGVALTINVLEETFGVVQAYDGVAFSHVAAVVVGGFALLTSSGWLLWGQASESGVVTALNLTQTTSSDVAEIASTVDRFLVSHELFLVEWSRLFWCGPDMLDFMAYGG